MRTIMLAIQLMGVPRAWHCVVSCARAWPRIWFASSSYDWQCLSQDSRPSHLLHLLFKVLIVSTAIIGINKGRVTMNSEADSRIPPCVTVAPAPGAGTRQPVTITPISPFVPPATPKPPIVIQKVLLKTVSKVGKNVSKMFTLRNMSRDNLKGEI